MGIAFGTQCTISALVLKSSVKHIKELLRALSSFCRSVLSVTVSFYSFFFLLKGLGDGPISQKCVDNFGLHFQGILRNIGSVQDLFSKAYQNMLLHI